MPQRELNIQEFKAIVRDIGCSVGGVEWRVHAAPLGDGYYVQLCYLEADIETNDPQDQHGRKWYLSKHATKSEIVQTVLKACLTSAEHMVREHFTYKEVRVFSPHFDVEKLVDLASGGPPSLDVRVPKE